MKNILDSKLKTRQSSSKKPCLNFFVGLCDQMTVSYIWTVFIPDYRGVVTVLVSKDTDASKQEK